MADEALRVLCASRRKWDKMPADISSDDAIAAAKAESAVAEAVSGKTVIKELYVPKRLVNIVVK